MNWTVERQEMLAKQRMMDGRDLDPSPAAK
jgi:hypothetical protein